MHFVPFFFAIVFAFGSGAGMAADRLSTHAERTAFRETGRYDEVVRLCGAFQTAYPNAVRCIEFGRTPEGRPMMAMVVTRTGALTAPSAHRRRIPVLLVQGGIHAGEIDGKDAGLLALREMLDGRAAPGALGKQVLVLVPVFNIDGHERFGRWNRPNQRGPVEMGWRTTAQNLNLNRDYAKADSPEMQAMLRLVDEWDPLATIDLHVTDGAMFEHDLSIQVEPLHAGDPALQAAGAALRDAVIGDLRVQGSLPVAFYPSFATEDDPASGFVDGVSPPRFSTGYFYLRNRFGMLVETHSWKDYPTRVRITRNVIVSVISQIATHGASWLELARAADVRAAGLAGQGVPQSYKASDKTRIVEFRGYEYTRTPSAISGALMTTYDERKPQLWRLPLRDELLADSVVTAPLGGYLVPAAHAQWVGQKLRLHGIAFRTMRVRQRAIEVETFRADKATFSARSAETRQRLEIDGAWKAEIRDVGVGALFVPIAQPKARLVMALLEPVAPDSLVAWGYFNAAFERKEYMEDYVAEEVAREQLAADVTLAAEFQRRIADDAAFAASKAARLEFFYRRHPSWDEQFNLYPVMRIATVP
ncbi:MAG: M14 family metallopeptidase, partial [Betaproteobacteria bacterium]